MTDRRAGSVGVQADIVFTPDRRVAAVAVQVDYVPSVGPVTYPVFVSATQASSLVLRRAATLTRAIGQAQTARIAISEGILLPIAVGQVLALRKTIALTAAVSVGTAAVLRKQPRATRTVTQAQTPSIVVGLGFQRIVSTTQATATRLIRGVRLIRWLPASRRIAMVVSLGRQVGRALRATQLTQPRLIKQVRLTRAIAQGTGVSFSGLPVQLRVVSTVQTRSLALGQTVFLTRSITQSQTVALPRSGDLVLTTVQATQSTLERAVSLTRDVRVASEVVVDWRDVTPLYEVLVTTSVSQSLMLTWQDSGQSAREFLVSARRQDFVVSSRSGRFATGRRGVRFTVGSR